MKKHSAVEIANDIITTKAHAFVEPNGAGEHLKILAQAVIDAEKAVKSIPFLSDDPGVKNCYKWLKKYTGEE